MQGTPGAHELRDVFFTRAIQVGCAESATNFVMGHIIDRLGYNKASNDDQWVWGEMSKIHGPAAVTEDALASRDAEIGGLREDMTKIIHLFRTYVDFSEPVNLTRRDIDATGKVTEQETVHLSPDKIRAMLEDIESRKRRPGDVPDLSGYSPKEGLTLPELELKGVTEQLRQMVARGKLPAPKVKQARKRKA